jgi:hypothetical protein
MASNDLLEISLSAAVPLWIENLKARPWCEVKRRADICAQAVAEHGDVILYRSKKLGASADAFNRLAEGLAACAFAPGGVKFLGLHFEAKHPELPRP